MVEFLTQQQLGHVLLTAQAPRDKLLIRTLYESGCTVSELVQLQREDLRRHHILIHNRATHVSEDLLHQLQEFVRTHNSAYIFPSRQRGQLSDKRIQQIVKKILKQSEVPLKKQTPIIFRYTHVAHALEQNIPVYEIQKQLGLGDLRIAQIVSAIKPEDTNSYERWMP